MTKFQDISLNTKAFVGQKRIRLFQFNPDSSGFIKIAGKSKVYRGTCTMVVQEGIESIYYFDSIPV